MRQTSVNDPKYIMPPPHPTRITDPNDLDLASVYLSYAEAGVASSDSSRPRTGRSKSARPKSSKLRQRR